MQNEKQVSACASVTPDKRTSSSRGWKWSSLPVHRLSAHGSGAGNRLAE